MNLTLILFGRTVVDLHAAGEPAPESAPVAEPQPVESAPVDETPGPASGATSHFGFSHTGTWRRPVIK